MKIRSDYVSNSSSSSFIVVLPKDYSLDTFIDEVVKSCSEKQEYEYDRKVVEDIDKSNRINLEYCLNNYVLLFLGRIEFGEVQYDRNGKECCDKLRKLYGLDVGQVGKNARMVGTVLVNEDEHIVISEPRYESKIVVSKNSMERSFRPWSNSNEIDEAKKHRIQRIVKSIELGLSGRYDAGFDFIRLYEITKDTILNTKDLIEAGYSIELPTWANDLDSITKRLESGDRLFGIWMSQGGDGMSSGKIYALNGWDSNFTSNSDVEVLDCECC